MMKQGAKIKLDVCGGEYPLEGTYINIDIRHIPGVDVVSDITKGLPFRTGVVDEIVSCGTLEHFSRSQLQTILKEFFRVMKNGALLRVAIPDLRALINAYSLGRIDLELMNQYLYGRAKDKYDEHKVALDFEGLSDLLREAGFMKIRKVPYSLPFHIPHLMMEVECWKDSRREEAWGSNEARGERHMEPKELKFTGERLVPTDPQLHDLYIKHISRYLFASQYAKDATVLDAGCGCGYGTYRIALAGARSVVGIDNSFPAIDFSRRHYSLKNTMYMVADCLHMPFKEESFDQVISFEVLEHVEDYRRYLMECRRVLRSGGMFIVSTPNKGQLGDKQNPYHVKEFHLEELEYSLKEYFEVIDILGQDIAPRYVVESDNQQIVYTFLATMMNYYEELFKYTERQLGVLKSTTDEKIQELNSKIFQSMKDADSKILQSIKDSMELIQANLSGILKEMPLFVLRSLFPVRLKAFIPRFVRRWIRDRLRKKIEYFWCRLDHGEPFRPRYTFPRPQDLRTRIYFPVNQARRKLSRPHIEPLPLSLSDIVIRKESREVTPYLIALCKK